MIVGSWLICQTPVAASTANQTRMIGPKALPTRRVPWRWTRNRPIRMPTEIGTTQVLSAGATTSSPSAAPSTEIAGVMTLSP